MEKSNNRPTARYKMDGTVTEAVNSEKSLGGMLTLMSMYFLETNSVLQWIKMAFQYHKKKKIYGT